MTAHVPDGNPEQRIDMTLTEPTDRSEQMTATPGVPFVDLGIQTRLVAAEIRERWDTIIGATAFVLGPDVETFEREFAAYSGARHAIGVGNGTDALELAMRGAGIGPGDEVILPANTFVATAEGVERAGAQVVLADCDDDYLIDPASVADRVTPRTRAVVGVHLYGQMAPIARLREVVGPDVLVLEDAAQSQGASRDGGRSGGVGDVAATSFYPGKNLGAFGDAGAVLTSHDDVERGVRQLRNHGGVAKYEHELVGTNSRLDTLQAAVLSVKLRHLDGWNAERQEAAARYATLLGGQDAVQLPRQVPGCSHVWHLYVVRVGDRPAVSAALAEAGIGHGIHYPSPIHLLPAFRHLGRRVGDLPVAEGQAPHILSLPMFPGITAEQQERVSDVLVRAVTGDRLRSVVA